MAAVPFRCYAIKDGDALPAWWVTTNNRLFTRTDGIKETVTIAELTWVGHGLADPDLFGLFEKRLLFTKNCM